MALLYALKWLDKFVQRQQIQIIKDEVTQQKLYEINPKGWLRSEEKCSKILFEKGVEKEEFIGVHDRILGNNSDLKKIKVLEIIETTRVDEEGGELLNLGSDFHHMYLILKLEETQDADDNKNKNKFNFQKKKKNQKMHSEENLLVSKKNNQQSKDSKETYFKSEQTLDSVLTNLESQEQTSNFNNNNSEENINKAGESSNKTRIVWLRLEYLRKSRMQFFYALKYRRIPQDFGKLLRIRKYVPSNNEEIAKINLNDLIIKIHLYQNEKEFDPWEHNCQRFIKTMKQMLDVQEI